MRYSSDTIIAAFHIVAVGVIIVFCWVRINVSHVLNSLLVACLSVVVSLVFDGVAPSQSVHPCILFVCMYMLGFAVGLPFRSLMSMRKRSSRHPGCCEACGYDFRGLTMPRCPECGQGFEIDGGEAITAMPGHLDASPRMSISIVYVLSSVLSLLYGGLLYATMLFAGPDELTDASGVYLSAGFLAAVVIALLSRSVVVNSPIGRIILFLAAAATAFMAVLWWTLYA